MSVANVDESVNHRTHSNCFNSGVLFYSPPLQATNRYRRLNLQFNCYFRVTMFAPGITEKTRILARPSSDISGCSEVILKVAVLTFLVVFTQPFDYYSAAFAASASFAAFLSAMYLASASGPAFLAAWYSAKALVALSEILRFSIPAV